MIQALKVAERENEESPVPDLLSSWREQPIVFECEGSRLIGIAAVPVKPVKMGVVIVVGGPQYRAGSHRQFTLLARHLASENIASFRFDYRGMGDSEGDVRNFEVVDADIRAAIDTFLEQVPSVSTVVIWGLCDAASAALFYGHTDSRVNGLILLNPWVHSEQGAAKTRLKHYYLTRLMQPSFWTKLFSSEFSFADSIGGLLLSFRSIFNRPSSSDEKGSVDPRHGGLNYIDRMLDGLKRFEGTILFILSGNDLTAREFLDLVRSDIQWKMALKSANSQQKTIVQANHTFSSSDLRNQVMNLTVHFIQEDCN
jgi:exosortase A-associated hydrolase 1